MSLTAALLFCLAPVSLDGDTVRCGNNLSWTRIRVWGVNAPEVGTAGADLAKSALQKRVTGGIVCEPRGTSYSRIVALCYDGTGRDVGLELLKVDKTVTEACNFTQNRTSFPLGYYGTCAALPPR